MVIALDLFGPYTRPIEASASKSEPTASELALYIYQDGRKILVQKVVPRSGGDLAVTTRLRGICRRRLRGRSQSVRRTKRLLLEHWELREYR